MSEYGAAVGWYWQGKPKDSEINLSQLPLCPPQIPRGLTWARACASAVSSRRLTAWPIACLLLDKPYQRLKKSVKHYLPSFKAVETDASLLVCSFATHPRGMTCLSLTRNWTELEHHNAQPDPELNWTGTSQRTLILSLFVYSSPATFLSSQRNRQGCIPSWTHSRKVMFVPFRTRAELTE
jgi:hypothetical protein